MERETTIDPAFWKREFGVILKRLFTVYGLNYKAFANTYHWSACTVRYWFTGRNLPQYQTLSQLKAFFTKELRGSDGHDAQFYEDVSTVFQKQHLLDLYKKLRTLYPHINQFAGELLETCYSLAKNGSYHEMLLKYAIPASGRTQAVVFDFDGTLTSGKTTRTTWESLWLELGYDVKLCQQLHQQYDRAEITHAQWCKLTEEKFKERHLNERTVLEIASRIQLIDGVEETFQILERQAVKIYIVSGSILTVIRAVLGDIRKYIEGIRANEFIFDPQDGELQSISGTKYDFEGKAEFITKIAADLEISPEDILFVGNSINDRFAYKSGAQTLCINPKLTDTTKRTVWNECIPTCDDLRDILAYVRLPSA